MNRSLKTLSLSCITPDWIVMVYACLSSCNKNDKIGASGVENLQENVSMHPELLWDTSKTEFIQKWYIFTCNIILFLSQVNKKQNKIQGLAFL